MSSIRTTRGKRELTSEAFAKFLARLNAEPERAGEQYEAVRLALVKFFDWQCRHQHFPVRYFPVDFSLAAITSDFIGRREQAISKIPPKVTEP